MQSNSKTLLSTSFRQQADRIAHRPPHLILVEGVTEAEATEGGEYLIQQMCKQYSLKQGDVMRFDGTSLVMEVLHDLTQLVGYHFEREVARICFITSFDAVNMYVQNAMLKMVEQPSAGVVYVLSAHQAEGSIIDTIASRAQIMRVNRPGRSELKEYFTPRYAEQAIEQAMLLAKGDPHKMSALLGNDASDINAAKHLLSLHKFERLVEIEKYSKDRDGALELVRAIQDILLFLLRQQALKGNKAKLADIMASLEHTERCEHNLSVNGNVKLNLVALSLRI